MTPTRTCLAILVATAACGGSPKPAPAPAPVAAAEPAPAAAEPAAADDEAFAAISGPGEAEPAAAPAPPPRPKFDQAAFLARLHDADGPVAGLEAYVVSHRTDPNVCGGLALEIKRKKGKKIAKADEVFAQVLDLASPSGLDFSPDHKAESMEKFNTWYTELGKRAADAATQYRATVAELGAVDKAVVPAARLVQVAGFAAARLARFEVPVDVRAMPEAVEIFCETVAEQAGALLDYAESGARACAERAATAGKGWWTAVCTAP